MDPFSQLSLDQLARVLAHVDIRTRLSSCSLVSSTWRAAAATATTAVAVQRCSAPFVGWLQSHTAAVQVTSLSLVDSISQDRVVLPLFQLRGLKSLELNLGPRGWLPLTSLPQAPSSASSSIGAAGSCSCSYAGSLEQLTALKQLRLSGCSVRLAGLSTLTRLQELAIHGVDFLDESPPVPGCRRLDCIKNFKEAEAELVAAFPKLQRLTSLRLQDTIGSAAVLAQVSALKSLQQLEVVDTPADFPAALPESLTRLHFAFECLFSTAPPHAITTTNAASLSRLTALESLCLDGVQPLDTAVLVGMTRLRALNLSRVEHAAGSQRLAVLSGFTALTSLCIDGSNLARCHSALVTGSDYAITITAAEAAALTTAPHLASFTFSGNQRLAPANWADVFLPDRQFLHLTELNLPADFLGSPDIVRRVGRCAPNLQQVVFNETQFYHNPPEGSKQQHDTQLGEGVGVLAGWSQLRKLSLINPWRTFPGCVWDSLGALTQISSLRVRLSEKPDIDDVLCLERCASLASLDINCQGDTVLWELKMRSTAPPGDPPNVAQRLDSEVWQSAALHLSLSTGQWLYSDEDDEFGGDGYGFGHGGVVYDWPDYL